MKQDPLAKQGLLATAYRDTEEDARKWGGQGPVSKGSGLGCRSSQNRDAVYKMLRQSYKDSAR